MPQLEGPTTKNTQLCSEGLWGEKAKIKILKKKDQLNHYKASLGQRSHDSRLFGSFHEWQIT